MLALTLGAKQTVVCINKMDGKTVNFFEERHNEIKKVGYKTDTIPFIPISGFNNDNMLKKSPNTPWYKGTIFIGALDNLEPPKTS